MEQVKENFSINGEQAENVIKQLETIGVLGGRSEDGTHKVMMDKEAFTNRIRGYQSLADRMRAISASKIRTCQMLRSVRNLLQKKTTMQ